MAADDGDDSEYTTADIQSCPSSLSLAHFLATLDDDDPSHGAADLVTEVVPIEGDGMQKKQTKIMVAWV